MATVFISYSRKDIEFAKRLSAELQKCELDFWIDWEGIPPTVDWWKEIQKGIEEADIFLFLISPDSAKSKVCGQEIDIAVKNGKRLIPVVVREIEWQDTPPQLGHLNYIFFSREDDFPTATNKLIQAIQTDYAWAATHRRLQVKALEWERNHQENSFLLRGKDLREAELQLATNTSKEPHPTDLQRSYVFKSRSATDRQRRFVTRISIASAIIMSALAVFAFIQLRIVRAQNLGSQAQVAFAEQDFATAGLYAYQSNQIHENDAADLILAQLPYEKFLIGKRLSGHTNKVFTVAWSNDGHLASMDYRGKIIIWDMATSRPSQTLDVNSFYMVDVAWSPDGRLASTNGLAGGITIWNLSTGQAAQTIRDNHIGLASKIVWLDNSRLAIGTADGNVIIWDLSTNQPVQILKGHTDQISSLAWSGDGHLASGSNDKTIIIWDLATGHPAQVLKGSRNSVVSLAWSADDRLASSDMGYQITIWNLSAGQPAQTLEDHFLDFTSIAWSQDGKLASGSMDNHVIIWDLATGLPADKLSGHGDRVESVAWSTDGRLASASDDTSVLIWDFSARQPVPMLTGHTDAVEDVAWSADGQLASASDDGTVMVWNIYTGQPALVLKGHSGPVTSVAWSKDGRLASGSRNKTVILWDLENARPAQILKSHTDPVLKVAWSGDGRLLSSTATTTIIWDLATGQPAQIVKGGDASWSATGQLASAFENSTMDTIFIRDSLDKPTYTLKSKTMLFPAFAWSTNGRLASTQYDFDSYTRTPIFSIVIWNLNTRQPAQTLPGSKGVVYSNAWSADGQLASAYSDVDDQRYEILLWDLSKGIVAQTLKGHRDEISSLAWSTQGDLASASTDRTIRIARPELLRGNPCDWLNRNLTIKEWMEYQGPLYVYEPACATLPIPQFFTPNNEAYWVDNPQTLLITWQGRGLILTVVLFILFGLAVMIWAVRFLLTWLWSTVGKSRGK